MGKLFGTDGFRGIANEELTPIKALKIGYAVAKTFDQVEKPILVAHDTRISSEMLENAIAAGISSVGKDVILCGLIPTPALAMLCKLERCVGVMISASHNPPEYNGIKVIYKGQKLSDDVEEKIEEIYFSDDFKSKRWSIGRVSSDESLKDEYIEYIIKNVAKDMDLKGLNILVDLANGAAISTVPETLKELGAKVYTISNELNGMKINVGCGSTNPEYLLSNFDDKLHHIAASFDGDADRCIMARENKIIDGDYIMAMNSLYMKKYKNLKRDTLVATVMSNYGMERFLNERKINLIRTKVGDRYVLERMLNDGYNLGGEQSGHVIFLDYSPTGDGLITLLRTLKVFTDDREVFEDVIHNLKKLPQFLENVYVDDKEKIIGDFRLLKRLDEIQRQFGDKGRVLVRPSGTEKLIRIMVECEEVSLAKETINHLKEVIVDLSEKR